MSDRLAVSASLSVLMMSIYVLFGADAARAPFTSEDLRAPAALSAPAAFSDPGHRSPYID